MVVLLPRAGDARQDDQAFRIIAEFFDGGRQAERGEIGNDVVDAPRDQRQPATLLEQADAETALVLADDVGIIDAAFLVEDLAASWGLRLGSISRSMSSCVSGRISMRRMSPRGASWEVGRP